MQLRLAGMAAAKVVGIAPAPVLPFLVGLLIQHFGLDARGAGLVVSAQLLAGACATLAVAPLLTRFNARRLAIGAALAAATGNAIAAATTDVGMLVASRVLTGAAEGVLLSVASGAAALTGRTERVMALYSIAVGIYSVLMLVIAPALITAHGATAAFGLMALVDLLGAVALLGFPLRAALVIPAGSSAARGIWAACALGGLGLFALGAGGLQAFVERLAAAIGIDPAALGNALAIGAGLSILAPLLVMALGTRLGRGLPIAVGGAVLCVISWILTHTAHSALFLSNAALLGPLGLLLSPYLFGVLALLDASGRLAGAGPAFLMLGVALGPALAGIAISIWGLASLGIAAAMSFALAVVCVTAALRYARPTPVAHPSGSGNV